jgi:hypothetical protein
MRAVITADFDLYPDDKWGVRNAIMQAFRLRGINPNDAAFFSEEALCWPRLASDALPPVKDLVFGDPNGLTTREANDNGRLLRAWVEANKAQLGFTGDAELEVPSFHPVYRTDASGELKIDMIVEVVQSTNVALVPDAPPPEAGPGDMTVRSGVTLIIAKPPVFAGERDAPHVRYAIAKRLTPERIDRQRAMATIEAVKPKKSGRFAIDFALLHGGT